MKKTITFLILALCSSAAFASTAPAVNGCVSTHKETLDQNLYGTTHVDSLVSVVRVLVNSCPQELTVHLMYGDQALGAREKMILTPSGTQNSTMKFYGTGQYDVRFAVCPSGYTPSTSDTSIVDVPFDAQGYYCTSN
jgi:hypothetical protein